MKEARKKLILWSISLVITICLFSLSAQAQYSSSEISGSAETNTYVFLAEESTVFQTGGIAGVHWTYSVEGLLQLTLDPNAGTASFVHVDVKATDDNPLQRTLEPNEVFNMTTLAGTFIDDTTISFTGKAKDGSDILVTVTIEDDLIYLVGQTTPPPNSADFFLFSINAIARRKYSGGTGEPNEPYQIATAEDLILLSESPEDYDKHFILTADIDLDPNLPGRKVFDEAVIAPDIYDVDQRFQGASFAGVLDGNGHTISHLTIRGEYRPLGLFGYVGDGAKIRNLGVVDVDIIGTDYIGGLVGKNGGGRVINCYSNGMVRGNTNVGGLVGYNYLGGRIINSYSISLISGSSSLGGLVGNNSSMLAHCYARGNVEGNRNVGGLVGDNGYSGTITNCYTMSSVSGIVEVGGLVGRDNPFGPGEVTLSFWDTQASGQETSAGGTGKTTAQMQDPNTFMDAGWDFVGKPDGPSDIWAEPAGGGYPILWWQLSPLPELPSFSDGTGEPNDPYLISTASELNSIGYNPRLMGAHFKLSNDIDLEGLDLYIIGSEVLPFSGVFDGNGHIVSNFSYNFIYTSTDEGLIGIFRYVRWATIKDLGLVDPNVNAETGFNVGSLVGRLEEGNITNCYTEGGSVMGHSGVGGLVGVSDHGTINNCHVQGSDIVGIGYGIGGLVGSNYNGRITGCYLDGGSILGDYYVGGLIGAIYRGTITNCYSSSDVSGDESVGGLVGTNSDGTIVDCYSAGSATGTKSAVGGLVGWNEYGALTYCYSTGSVGGYSLVGGLVGSNSGDVIQCCSTGHVIGSWSVGGLAGGNYGSITKSYSTGTVSGGDYVGGLAGQNGSAIVARGGLVTPIPGVIFNCHSTGFVSGNMNVGGLVGSLVEGTIEFSFWDIEISGQEISAGGIGLITAEMQAAATFLEAGWDFVGETENGTEDIWWIDEGQDYPRLWWEPLERPTDEILFLLVDDFESYSDLIAWPDFKSIFDIWIDGFGNPENGAIVGYFDPPFCEQIIVHGGNQSMPFFYDNSDQANYSEATAKINTLEIGRDWTIEGVAVLSLWFYGCASNVVERMYVALNGSAIAYNNNIEDLLIEDWTEWTIDLHEFADQGTDLPTSRRFQ